MLRNFYRVDYWGGPSEHFSALLHMNQTQSLLVTKNKKNEFWRELFPKSRNSFYITDSQKRSYRDAKIKKLEEFWRENAVGIGLYNEFVLWWGVRFEGC